MKKRLLRLLSIAILLMIVSCAPYGGTLVYRFKFFNNSSRDIYIIIDNNTKDNIISAGSICDFVYANAWCYIDSGTPWSNIIKDSAYVYVIDTDLFDILRNMSLSMKSKICARTYLQLCMSHSTLVWQI